MGYNIEETRALVERWLAGGTTLAEEAALRDFFSGAQDELPGDLQPYRLLFGQSAEAAGERSHRRLILHTEPNRPGGILTGSVASRRPLRRWIAGAAAAVVAIAVVTTLIFAPERASRGDILCVVNGVQITDPGQIAAYTREAFEIANDNLRKPGETLSSELGADPAFERVGEMLNELAKNQ